MSDQAYGWDKSSQRFRSLETGTFASERDVRDTVDRVADLAARRMGESAARFRAGSIDMPAWIAESQQIIKSSQIAASLAAYGGRGQMTPQTWGRTGFEIKRQYQYLNRFALDVLDGRQRMNGRLDARARQYGQAARATYENTRRRLAAEALTLHFERNVLHARESCRGCLAATHAGRVPIGTLPPIGSRDCRGSCLCTLAFSQSMSEAA